MALQLFKIASTTVETPQASISFTSLPTGYTDLLIKISARDSLASGTANFISIKFNSSNTSYNATFLRGNGSTAASGNTVDPYSALSNGTTYTTNTFSNCDIYIPNYNGNTYKCWSAEGVVENNATGAYMALVAGQWANTSAITSIALTEYGGSNLVAGTTATLYGVL